MSDFEIPTIQTPSMNKNIPADKNVENLGLSNFFRSEFAFEIKLVYPLIIHTLRKSKPQ